MFSGGLTSLLAVYAREVADVTIPVADIIARPPCPPSCRP